MIYPPSVLAEMESDAAELVGDSAVLLAVAKYPADQWPEFLPMLLSAVARKAAEVADAAEDAPMLVAV